jgi:lipopolysaccharide export system permease protein
VAFRASGIYQKYLLKIAIIITRHFWNFTRKFSMPVACLVLGFLALPLGLQAKGTKRSFGLGLGLLFFLLFYLLLSAGKVYGEVGILPPAIGMWAPNIFMAGLGIYLFKNAGEENSFKNSFLPRQLRKLLIQ